MICMNALDFLLDNGANGGSVVGVFPLIREGPSTCQSTATADIASAVPDFLRITDL